jgi:alpha-1,2-mannosyltransferase
LIGFVHTKGSIRARRFSRALILFGVGNILVFNLVVLPWIHMARSSTPPGIFLLKFLRFESAGDSAFAMEAAYEHIRSGSPTPLYEDVFFGRKIKFQYPPTSLLPWLALRSEPGTALLASAHMSFDAVLTGISWLSVWATAFFAAMVFRESWRRTFKSDADPAWRAPPWAATLTTFALALFYYPILKGFSLGQIQVWIGALFAASFWCWLKGRKVAAGVLLALCCLIKPQLGVLLLLGLLRGEWMFCAGFAGTILGGVGASLFFVRPADYIGYAKVLSYVSRHGEAYYPNQSVNGLLHRLLFNGDSTRFLQHSYAPYHPWVFLGTLVTSVALVAVALVVRRRPRGVGRDADFALAALIATVASPVAWEHHYGVLVAIYAFLLPALVRYPVAGRTTMIGLALSFVLSSNYIGAVQRLREVPVANLAQSYLFGAALVVVAYLVLLRKQDPPTASADDEATA